VRPQSSQEERTGTTYMRWRGCVEEWT